VSYEPAWLDEQCLAGRFVWTRLSSRRSDPARGAAPVRATPIVLLARRNMRLWSTLAASVDATHLSASAQRVAQYLSAHGASFFDEIAPGPGLLPTQAEEALAELVALGLVNSDSFAGLRALLLSRRSPADPPWAPAAAAHRAVRDGRRGTLVEDRALRRHRRCRSRARRGRPWSTWCARCCAAGGVVFWRLLAREADWLPPWRDLLMCCRRLEARGEIRGGRFVAGFTGEQYAAPERSPCCARRAASRTRDTTCRCRAPTR